MAVDEELVVLASACRLAAFDAELAGAGVVLGIPARVLILG
jgi:hypothetical protein